MSERVTDSQTAARPTVAARAARWAWAAVAPVLLLAVAALAGGHSAMSAGATEPGQVAVVAAEAETEILEPLVVERTP